jgi:tetratricopeptide (TPR) repeat protein
MGASQQVHQIRCEQALSMMLAGDCDGARASLTAVLERSEADGQRSPFALHGLGLVAHRAGDQEEAVAWHRDAAELFLDHEERHAAAEALAGVAFARATLGDAEAAEAAVGSAVALLPPQPLTTTHPLLLEAAAAAAVAGGAPELGLRRLGRATALRERLGAELVAGDRFDVDRVEAEARRHLEDTRAEAAHASGRATEGLLPPVA